MYDVIIIGAGIAGTTFASKISKYAKTLLIEAQDYKKEIPIRTNVFPEHNRPFIKEEIDWNNKGIFPSPHTKSNYMSDEFNGVIDSTEFGIPLGNMCYTENLLEKLLNQLEEQGGTFKSNERISKINRHHDYLELINSKGESYKTRLLALATGSRGFDLQRSLGFEIPDHYTGALIHLFGDENKINENLEYNYVFHINPKISTNGPFYFNKGKERIATGFLGGTNESKEAIIEKLDRILKNYKRIQPIVDGLKYDLSATVAGEISKHPIKKFSNDRVLVLGEATGLVTAFFYEGLLPGVACADIATKTIKPLFEKDSNFNQLELKEYDKEVKRVLFPYFKNGNALEYLIYNEGSHVKSLWRLYTELLNENKLARKYIYEAYINQDLSKHNTSNDRYVGEKWFGKLPTLSKITLSPKFFKAMLL
ncbi:MAG: NAD(P)/FAD-dependent oxidoreductase [Promethearchaeota archaeon]|nr:MAG: NAD(P)/FAD-dependent oxidoreductase [Candidatus Lokiarchaeota archaeon]